MSLPYKTLGTVLSPVSLYSVLSLSLWEQCCPHSFRYNVAVPVLLVDTVLPLSLWVGAKWPLFLYKQYCTVHYSPCSFRYSTVPVPYRYSTAWYCLCPSRYKMSLFRKVQYCTIPVSKGTNHYGGRSPKFIWAPCHVMCTAVLIG
jgi:hypothetical protein